MKGFNVLTNKIEEKDFVSFKKFSEDYILSIPHSGLLIPFNLKENFNIGKELLTGSDLHTDKVYKTNKGFEIIANINPYVLNVSRFKDGSTDKTLPKHLQKDPFHGGSLIGGKILLKEHSKKEKEELLKYYNLYPSKLQEAINEMKKKKGYALIFDCHSMNSIALQNTPDEGEKRTDFNIGTLDDTSASKKIISIIMENFEKIAKNYTIKKNYPYKGGFIARKYAAPKNNIHIIQIETKKSLFMHEGLNNEKNSFEIKKDGLEKINKILSKIFEETSKKIIAVAGI